jgi:hypothetical protein
MPELSSTGHVSEELIAPDAGTQEHAEDPTPALSETLSAPSLPSIDSQRNIVSFRALWVALILTQILDLQSDNDSAIGSFTEAFVACSELV